MASVIPQVHLSRGLDVYQTRRLPLSLQLQDKKVGLLLRKTRGVFQSAVCALPWGGMVYLSQACGHWWFLLLQSTVSKVLGLQ